jgi:acetyl esterase
MPLDPQVDALLNQMATAGAPPIASQTVEEARAMAMSFVGTAGEEVPVASTRDIRIPVGDAQISARVYTPEGRGPHPVVMFFHGGGFVICGLDTHDNMARTICRDADAVVVSVDYRMAPEYPFPTAPKDCFAATQWVAAHASELDADGSRLAVAGDSAGGNLSAVVTQMARDAGGPDIRYAALIYPGTDMNATGGSMETNAKSYFLEREDIDWFIGHYIPNEADRGNPLASPVRHPNLAGLPACFIATCEFDPLADQGDEYGERLRANGVSVETKCYPGLIHGSASMAGIIDGGREILTDVGSHLHRALHD